MTATGEPKHDTGWHALIAGADRRERIALAWSFVFFFSQLFGYYILRSVREALISADGAHREIENRTLVAGKSRSSSRRRMTAPT